MVVNPLTLQFEVGMEKILRKGTQIFDLIIPLLRIDP